MPPVENLEAIEYRLGKRGFKRDDLFMHECPACKEQAVASYKIFGKIGGRDIKLCLACGVARSWRSGAAMQDRVEDPGFDLDAFLR